MTTNHHNPEAEEATMTETTITGWAALPVLAETDLRFCRGDIQGRNALLATVDPAMWNGREILPADFPMGEAR